MQAFRAHAGQQLLQIFHRCQAQRVPHRADPAKYLIAFAIAGVMHHKGHLPPPRVGPGLANPPNLLATCGSIGKKRGQQALGGASAGGASGKSPGGHAVDHKSAGFAEQQSTQIIPAGVAGGGLREHHGQQGRQLGGNFRLLRIAQKQRQGRVQNGVHIHKAFKGGGVRGVNGPAHIRHALTRIRGAGGRNRNRQPDKGPQQQRGPQGSPAAPCSDATHRPSGSGPLSASGRPQLTKTTWVQTPASV